MLETFLFASAYIVLIDVVTGQLPNGRLTEKDKAVCPMV